MKSAVLVDMMGSFAVLSTKRGVSVDTRTKLRIPFVKLHNSLLYLTQRDLCSCLLLGFYRVYNYLIAGFC